MNAKERNKLQQYIGHCSNLDEQIRYIETVNSVSPLTDEDWYKLYFPACGNCDVSLFKWLQKRGAKINYDAASLLKWTVNPTAIWERCHNETIRNIKIDYR